jgi:NAD(P)-dependent dehydrogenase (short-subunit alcohol dehydrogenase family)
VALRLAGAVAIVTGASSGIGAATARGLAKEGASVALLARRKDRLDALSAEIEKTGGTAFAVPSDIAYQAKAEAAVQAVVRRPSPPLLKSGSRASIKTRRQSPGLNVGGDGRRADFTCLRKPLGVSPVQ